MSSKKPNNLFKYFQRKAENVNAEVASPDPASLSDSRINGNHGGRGSGSVGSSDAEQTKASEVDSIRNQRPIVPAGGNLKLMSSGPSDDKNYPRKVLDGSKSKNVPTVFDTTSKPKGDDEPSTSRIMLKQHDSSTLNVDKSILEGVERITSDESVPKDLGNVESGPSQPRVIFPKTLHGDRMRSFSAKYYDAHSWIEYSVAADKVFCYVCRMFSTGVTRSQNEKFVASGFFKWKKLGESIKKHEEGSAHAQCLERSVAYTISKSTGNVQEQIMAQHQEVVEHNRDYMTKLISIILCLARQGLPLRGHREEVTSKNRGNFLEFCDVLGKFDKDFSSNLERYVNYCSPKQQNEIIETACVVTISQIVEEVKRCGFYALMVDEARSFKEEQLSVVIRYTNGLEVEERFLGFLNCSSSRDAQALKELITEFLAQLGLKGVPMIAQCYDGANVMSGERGGLQAKIKEMHPHAMYIHCLAHKLNLVVVDACADIKSSANFFGVLEALHVHFSKPGNHAHLKELRDSLGIKEGVRELNSLSTTRWSCRYQNCKAVLTNFAAIRNALEDEADQFRNKNAVEATGLLTHITKAEFSVNLVIFHKVLSITNVLTKYFQTKNASLGQASDIVIGTITSLKADRNNFTEVWKEIEKFASEHQIELKQGNIAKRRKQPRKLDDFVVQSTLGKSAYIDTSDEQSPFEFWRNNVYFTIMDSIIENFEARFNNLPFARAVDAFFNLKIEEAGEFVGHYIDLWKIDKTVLAAEAIVFKNVLNTKGLSCNLENLKNGVREDITPNIYKLLQIAIGLPVSSAGCERSFSAMRRIKTWLRTTMLQDRFSALAVLNIENEFVKEKVSAEQVLNIFAEGNRKMKLV